VRLDCLCYRLVRNRTVLICYNYRATRLVSCFTGPQPEISKQQRLKVTMTGSCRFSKPSSMTLSKFMTASLLGVMSLSSGALAKRHLTQQEASQEICKRNPSLPFCTELPAPSVEPEVTDSDIEVDAADSAGTHSPFHHCLHPLPLLSI
jgi:hypothetical protein